jgi:fucose permease
MGMLLLVLIYAAFISLGLPDGIFGASWPAISKQLAISSEFGGMFSMLCCGATILSSLMSGRMIARFGTGKIITVSTLITAVAMFLIPLSVQVPAAPFLPFALMCVCGVFLGFGGGCIDAALNNYVALHYKAKHMNWLHCFWGVGASVSPALLSLILTGGGAWQSGYFAVGILQSVLLVLLMFSLPMWKKPATDLGTNSELNFADSPQKHPAKPLTNLQTLKLPGMKTALIAFACYCGYESSFSLWTATYMATEKSMPVAQAAGMSSLFIGGITVGRLICGFLSSRFSMKILARAGCMIGIAGMILFILPLPVPLLMAGLLLAGLGAAPFYPAMMHQTPARFGTFASQSAVGLQMAVAYMGSTFLPPIVGLLPRGWMPACMLVLGLGAFIFSEMLNKLKKVD